MTNKNMDNMIRCLHDLPEVEEIKFNFSSIHNISAEDLLDSLQILKNIDTLVAFELELSKNVWVTNRFVIEIFGLLGRSSLESFKLVIKENKDFDDSMWYALVDIFEPCNISELQLNVEKCPKITKDSKEHIGEFINGLKHKQVVNVKVFTG